MDSNRRAFLAAVGAGLLAGCSSNAPGVVDEGPTETGTSETATASATATVSGTQAPRVGPPVGGSDRYMAYTQEELLDNMELVVGKDKIPAVDEPKFVGPDEIEIEPDEIVIGLERNGVVKAYPRRILVWHEITNDVVGGEPVAVTYCPLTATVMGFRRGDTTFGVSGSLINSNLVMYDRGTDSIWPQMVPNAIKGPMRGETLQEFRLTWTTWEQWHDAHPDTRVMSENTDYARNYGNDPYGSYNPDGGYYEENRTMFSLMNNDGTLHAKEMVLMFRTDSAAAAFHSGTLADEGVLSVDLDGVEHVAVHDRELGVGYVYDNPEGKTVEAAEGGARVDGEVYAASDLPLDSRYGFAAMWFSFAAFYPDAPLVN